MCMHACVRLCVCVCTNFLLSPNLETILGTVNPWVTGEGRIISFCTLASFPTENVNKTRGTEGCCLGGTAWGRGALWIDHCVIAQDLLGSGHTHAQWAFPSVLLPPTQAIQGKVGKALLETSLEIK